MRRRSRAIEEMLPNLGPEEKRQVQEVLLRQCNESGMINKRNAKDRWSLSQRILESLK